MNQRNYTANKQLSKHPATPAVQITNSTQRSRLPQNQEGSSLAAPSALPTGGTKGFGSSVMMGMIDMVGRSTSAPPSETMNVNSSTSTSLSGSTRVIAKDYSSIAARSKKAQQQSASNMSTSNPVAISTGSSPFPDTASHPLQSESPPVDENDPRRQPEYAAFFYNYSRVDPRLPPPIYTPGQSSLQWWPGSHHGTSTSVASVTSLTAGDGSAPGAPGGAWESSGTPSAVSAGYTTAASYILQQNSHRRRTSMDFGISSGPSTSKPNSVISSNLLSTSSSEPVLPPRPSESPIGSTRSGAINAPTKLSVRKGLVDMIQEDFPRTPSPVFGTALRDNPISSESSSGILGLSSGSASSHYGNNVPSVVSRTIEDIMLKNPSNRLTLNTSGFHASLNPVSMSAPTTSSLSFLTSDASLYHQQQSSGAPYSAFPVMMQHPERFPGEQDSSHHLLLHDMMGSLKLDDGLLGQHQSRISSYDRSLNFPLMHENSSAVPQFSLHGIPSNSSTELEEPAYHGTDSFSYRGRSVVSPSPYVHHQLPSQLPHSRIQHHTHLEHSFASQGSHTFSQSSPSSPFDHSGFQTEGGYPSGRIRSNLLEDFRNNKNTPKRYEIRDILDYIVEFSGDQYGSRFIQQKLEGSNPEDKHLIFQQILPCAVELMTDVFGNYVIQKFFELGSTAQRNHLARLMEGHVVSLSLQMYGCRVVQKALEYLLGDLQTNLISELDGHVLRLVKDQNGNHVIQKCIERMPLRNISFIISAFRNNIYNLATHPYGCRVIQRIFEHAGQSSSSSIVASPSSSPPLNTSYSLPTNNSTLAASGSALTNTDHAPDQIQVLLDELHLYTPSLVTDQYGNYVIQHILEKGAPRDKNLIISVVKGQLLSLSRHKFASNVVEKCVTFGAITDLQDFIHEITTIRDVDGILPLTAMMKDQFGNYVLQKILDAVCRGHTDPNDAILLLELRDLLVSKIRPHIGTLRKYTYGKHILAKVERILFPSGNPGSSPNTTSNPMINTNLNIVGNATVGARNRFTDKLCSNEEAIIQGSKANDNNPVRSLSSLPQPPLSQPHPQNPLLDQNENYQKIDSSIKPVEGFNYQLDKEVKLEKKHEDNIMHLSSQGSHYSNRSSPHPTGFSRSPTSFPTTSSRYLLPEVDDQQYLQQSTSQNQHTSSTSEDHQRERLHYITPSPHRRQPLHPNPSSPVLGTSNSADHLSQMFPPYQHYPQYPNLTSFPLSSSQSHPISQIQIKQRPLAHFPQHSIDNHFMQYPRNLEDPNLGSYSQANPLDTSFVYSQPFSASLSAPLLSAYAASSFQMQSSNLGTHLQQNDQSQYSQPSYPVTRSNASTLHSTLLMTPAANTSYNSDRYSPSRPANLASAPSLLHEPATSQEQ